MKLFMFCIVLILIVTGSAVAQMLDINPTPPWLLDSKRVSMHHSLSFSYGTYANAYQSIYKNSIRYTISPQLTLSGTFGYSQLGSKYSKYKSLLHGFGIMYHPTTHLQIQFHYQGASPLSKPSSVRKLNYLGNN